MRSIAAILLSGVTALVSLQPAWALDPNRSLAQFHHTHWSLQDGFPGLVDGLAQTPDGFLWIASVSGLYRFDGIRAERFGADQLPVPSATVLATSEQGDLWVGLTDAHIARVRSGEVTSFSVPTPGIRGPVHFLAPDNHGGVWVSLRDRVFHFDGRRWRAIPSPWPAATTYSQPGGVWGLALGRDGTLWAKNLLGLYHLRPGAAGFEPTPGYAGGLVDFARDAQGRLWTADFATRRFYVLPDLAQGRPVPPPQWGAPVPPSVLAALMLDRDGTLWNANRVTGGLYRTSSIQVPSAAERFAAVGRPLNLVTAMLEDREGAIWLASPSGLERLRPANIVREPTLRVRHQAAGITASRDAVFVYSGMGAREPAQDDAGRRLYRLRPGQPPETVVEDIGQLQAISASPGGDLVMAREGRLLRWRDGELTAITVPQALMGAHVVNLVAVGPDGLLVSAYGRGVWQLSSGEWRHIAPPSARPADQAEVAADAAGAAWLFYRDGLIVRVDGQRLQEFPREIGARLGRIRAALADREGLIVAGTHGLGRFDGRSLQVLPVTRVPRLSLAVGLAQTPDGDVWILTETGVARVKRAHLIAAFAARTPRVEVHMFDAADGFKGNPPGDLFNSSITAGADGRVWFLTPDDVAWIDPARLYRNPRPPPVVIRSVTANGRTYTSPAQLRLPPGTSRLQIDYTALSLAAPEGVRFRYRLEGVDEGWVDAGGRRQAFYTNLAPGDYRFQVIAANRDGVWNTRGAALRVTLRPTFWQTWIFKALLALIGLAALWGLYRLRLRQVSERIRARLAERMDERERIARELHDTLLQAFQGLTLKLQAYAEQLPAGQPARKLMEEALDRADEVLVEGRDRVRNLRSSQVSGDLPEALAAAVERLRFDPAVGVRVEVQGEPRPVHPVVFDEVVAIAGEALFNAFTHAQAESVTLQLRYDARQLTLRVRDDGAGIPAEVLEHGREGHFGLKGMRERAGKIRGELRLRSAPGEGAEVSLVVPAGHAFVRPGRRWLAFRPLHLELED